MCVHGGEGEGRERGWRGEEGRRRGRGEEGEGKERGEEGREGEEEDLTDTHTDRATEHKH